MSRFEPSEASADFPLSSGPTRSMVVATTPRSGSTLLSKGLWATGLAGAPMEYFNPEDRAGFEARWGPLELDAYIQQLHRHRTSPNGVFSVKLHYDQLSTCLSLHPERFAEWLPACRYVYLQREDKLRQAISFYRALKSEQWVATRGTEADDLPFSAAPIIRFAGHFVAQELLWTRWFARNGIEPLRIRYRSLVESYDRTMRTVLKHTVDAVPDHLPSAPLRRQAGAVTDQWVTRLRAEIWPLPIQTPRRVVVWPNWQAPDSARKTLEQCLQALDGAPSVGLVLRVAPEDAIQPSRALQILLDAQRAGPHAMPPFTLEVRPIDPAHMPRFGLAFDGVVAVGGGRAGWESELPTPTLDGPDALAALVAHRTAPSRP